MNFNLVILEGRLTRDPELKQVGEGIDVTNFGLAVNRRFSKNDEVDFFNVECWRKLAELVATHKNKGDLVLVKGSLKNNQVEKDGQKITYTTVVADEVVFQPGKNDNAAKKNDDEDNEDIPF